MQGVQEIFGLKRVQPWIHSTKDSICVFYGHLSNTDELLDRLHKGAFEDSGSSNSSLVSASAVSESCAIPEVVRQRCGLTMSTLCRTMPWIL